MNAEQPEQHYHLVAGNVVFHTADGQSMGSLTLNTVLRNATNLVPARQIGRAQQALQMLFFERTGDPTNVVVDVVIIAVSYLGFMSEEEFNAPPEGMVQQERSSELPN
jgi:hypothetical protein